MTKNGVKMLAVAAAVLIPLTTVLVKNNSKVEKLNENKSKITSVKVKTDDDYNTLSFYEDDFYLYDTLENPYYLVKDNNCFLCSRKTSSGVDLETMEVIDVKYEYYDVNNERYLRESDGYTVYTIEEFNELIKTSPAKTRKLTIMN